MCLGDEANATMPRNESKAVPEGYGPVSYDGYESGKLTMVELYRMLKGFDEINKNFDRRTTDKNKGSLHLLGR